MTTIDQRRATGPFHDRYDAGRQLAERLRVYANRPDTIVLALPRGGVPVGYEVARALHIPFDVFLVRKLGVPGHEELAMGAIASDGVRVLNEEVVQNLGISEAVIDTVAAIERRELSRRERLYRGSQPPPEVRGKTVILVDDGLATGSTMRAAVEALRQLRAARIVVATPVAAPSVCDAFQELVDEMVCSITPEPFYAVGLWYEEFGQTSDDEVRRLLAEAGEWYEQQPPRTDSADSRRGTATVEPSTDVEAIRRAARPVRGDAHDYDELLDLIGDARFVLIGEASHGTHDFY